MNAYEIASLTLAMTFVMRKYNKLVRSLITCHCEEWSDKAISQIQVITLK